MNIIVQKFGGSSVATTEKLFGVCKHIIREYEKGNSVVVVVSAQGKTTDKLISEEAEITKAPSRRSHDMLVSVGEQITVAKLSMCLDELGFKASPYLAWQLPIITENKREVTKLSSITHIAHGESRIKSIKTNKIKKDLKDGNIVIIAGFQGLSENGEITTLGRGGSDTTAVALATALNAEKCDIYTDVDGVYNADPNKVADAVKFETIGYDEMLNLANSGAKVLHNRCIEIAKNFNLPIVVRSTFNADIPGTVVGNY